jgi:hypothetical protein
MFWIYGRWRSLRLRLFGSPFPTEKKCNNGEEAYKLPTIPPIAAGGNPDDDDEEDVLLVVVFVDRAGGIILTT